MREYAVVKLKKRRHWFWGFWPLWIFLWACVTWEILDRLGCHEFLEWLKGGS